jgi:hypothetical protein
MSRLRELLPNTESHETEGATHIARHRIPDRINPILVHFVNETVPVITSVRPCVVTTGSRCIRTGRW